MAAIYYTLRARTDLDSITNFYVQLVTEDKLRFILTSITNAINSNASNTISEGNLIKGTRYTTYRWLVYNKKYHVYYRRQKNGTVRILRVYGTSRRPLKLDEIGN